jgi:hypothetical protein
MAIRKLDRGEWLVFCARATRGLAGKRAEIEITSLSVGAQVEAKWLPFRGMAYDARNDTIEIALEGRDHRVRDVLELYVDEEPIGLTSFELVGRDGARQIVLLRDPLMLPAPLSDS